MLMTAVTQPALAANRRFSLDDIGARLAGLGALAFVAIVVVQNLVRGGSAPANGASGGEVLAYYADHRATTFLLVATFVLSGAGLATFLGGAMRRLLAGGRPGWAIAGGVGAAGMLALFAVIVACEQALSVLATGDRPDVGAIEALWTLHNSAFTVLYVLLAVTMLGLARAGVAAGLTPRVFERLAPAGATLLAAGAIAGPAIAAGDAMPVFALAGLGFLVWLAFLTTTGLRLVRGAA
jgi:hypothetical protein